MRYIKDETKASLTYQYYGDPSGYNEWANKLWKVGYTMSVQELSKKLGISDSWIVDCKRSLTSTCSTLAISTSVSNEGCARFVHHFEMVASPLSSCSASHLLVHCFSARTTLIRFNPLFFDIFLGFILHKGTDFL